MQEFSPQEYNKMYFTIIRELTRINAETWPAIPNYDMLETLDSDSTITLATFHCGKILPRKKQLTFRNFILQSEIEHFRDDIWQIIFKFKYKNGTT